MKYLKMLGLAAVAAMALMAVTAGTASATTLEVNGAAQNKAVAITASAESSVTLSDTEKAQANTCSVSSVAGTTSVFSGEKVTGSLSELSFTTCARSPVTVDVKGGLYIINEAGTTSGSVFSEGASVTVPTTFGCSSPAPPPQVGPNRHTERSGNGGYRDTECRRGPQLRLPAAQCDLEWLLQSTIRPVSASSPKGP